MKGLLVLIWLVAVSSSIAENTRLKEAFSWKTVEFDFGSPEKRAEAISSKAFIPDNNLPLGLDVWKGKKLFITVPRWKTGVPSSLNYIDVTDYKVPEDPESEEMEEEPIELIELEEEEEEEPEEEPEPEEPEEEEPEEEEPEEPEPEEPEEEEPEEEEPEEPEEVEPEEPEDPEGESPLDAVVGEDGLVDNVGGLLTNSNEEGILDNVGDLTEGLTDTVDGLTGGLTDTLGGLTGGLTDPVGEVLGGVTGGVGDTVGDLTGGLTDTVGGLTDTVSDLTGGLGDTVGGLTDAVDLGETVGGLTDTVSDLTGGLTDAVDLGDTVGGLTDTVGDLTGGLTDAVDLGDTVGGLTDTVGDLTGGLTDAVDLGDTVGGLTDTVGDLTGGLTDAVDLGDTVGGLTDTVGDLTGGLTDAVGDLDVGDTVGDLTDGVGDALDGLTGNEDEVTADADAIDDAQEEIEEAVEELEDAQDDIDEEVQDSVEEAAQEIENAQEVIEEAVDDAEDAAADDDEEEELDEGEDEEESFEEDDEDYDYESEEESEEVRKRKFSFTRGFNTSSIGRGKYGKIRNVTRRSIINCIGSDCDEIENTLVRRKVSKDDLSGKNSIRKKKAKTPPSSEKKGNEIVSEASSIKAISRTPSKKSKTNKKESEGNVKSSSGKLRENSSVNQKKTKKSKSGSSKKGNSKAVTNPTNKTKKSKKKNEAKKDKKVKQSALACGGRNPCGKPEPELEFTEVELVPPKDGKDCKKKQKKNKKKQKKQKKACKKPKKPKKECVKPAKVSKTSPALIPYPSLEANTPLKGAKSSETRITSVFRVRVDACDRLWVMDTGVADVTGEYDIFSKPQIVIYNLNDDSLIRKYTFKTEDTQESSFFANIIVDVEKDKCDNAFAYVPDLGSYAIVVYDFKNDKAWRIKHNYFHFNPLAGNYDVGGVKFQWTDGVFSVALTSPHPDGSKTAYFHALSSTTQFKVNSHVLQTEAEGKESNYTAYQIVGDKGPKSQTSASFIHPSTGVMFYTQVNKDAIYCWNTKRDFVPENLVEVASDPETLIFPNDLKVDDDNNVWVLTDKLPVFLTKGLDPKEVNYRIFVSRVADAIKDTNCAL